MACCLALRWTDHLDAAERVTEQWTEIARRQGSEEAFAAARIHSGHLNRMRGRLRQAEADAETATAAAPQGSVNFVIACVALTDCLINQGDLGAAQAAYDAIGFGERIPPFPPYGGVRGIRAELCCALGQHAAALADYEELTGRSGGRRSGTNIAVILAAIESHHALVHQDVVKTELDQAVTLAQQWGTPSAIGSVMRVCGRLAGDPAQAIEDLRTAIEYLQRSPRRLVHARALVDLGSALRRAAAAPTRASRCAPGMSWRASAAPTDSLKPPASSFPPAGSGFAANGSPVPSPSPRASDESLTSPPQGPATQRSRKRSSSPQKLSRCT